MASAEVFRDDALQQAGEQSLASYDAQFRKVLSEENPSVSVVMVNALNGNDMACALFMSYITRIAGIDANSVKDGAELILDGPSDKLVAPGGIIELQERESDEVTDALLLSYRATMLLTNDDSSDALLSFLTGKTKLITKCIFPIFQKNSRGNLRHGCRVIDHLLRLYLNDVYDVIGKNANTVKRYMGSMLQYIDQAPVAEVFLTLVCKPHNAALMRFYSCTPQKKWAFFKALSDWKLLVVLGEHVWSTKYSEQHAIGAADVFVELLDRLAADENGELLLQPCAYCPELLEGLITAAVGRDDSRSMGQRTAAMKCVFRLLQKSILEKVQGPPTSPYQTFGGTIVNLVPNQLAPLREQIYELMEKHMDKLLCYLVDTYEDQQNIEMKLEPGKPLPEGAVRHTGYVVKVPFTEFRLTLVETLMEIVAHNPSKMGDHFDVNVWRVLMTWFFEYSHNNLYHAAFYQLVFIALRTDNQATLEVLVKKLKLVTHLIDHYRSSDACTSNRGYILQCCNAIRLQAASQSPDAFLRNFLQSHTTWRNFESELRAQTSLGCVNGLGFNVPQGMRGGYQQKDWQMIEEEQGIDHGSEYARSLGFVDDVAWPEDDNHDTSKKKRGKKKKHKKKENGAAASTTAETAGSNGVDSDPTESEEETASNDDDELIKELIEEEESKSHHNVNGSPHHTKKTKSAKKKKNKHKKR